MFAISKEFHFSASHLLEGLPDDHPCSRCHGHNYVAIFKLQSAELNDVGFVRDYRELKPVKEFIDDNFDHRHLNDVMDINPTAENMAKFLFDRFKDTFPNLVEVSICETPKTVATYYE